MHQVRQCARNTGPKPAKRFRSLRQLWKGLAATAIRKRTLSGEAFVQGHAKSVDVRCRRERFAAALLRRHVGIGSFEIVPSPIAARPRRAEIEEHRTSPIDDNVSWLHVEMEE